MAVTPGSGKYSDKISSDSVISLPCAKPRSIPPQAMDSESECDIGERDVRDMEIHVVGDSDMLFE